MFNFWYPVQDGTRGFKVLGRTVTFGKVNTKPPGNDIKLLPEESVTLSYVMIMTLLSHFNQMLLNVSTGQGPESDVECINLSKTCRICAMRGVIVLELERIERRETFVYARILEICDGDSYTDFFSVLLQVAPFTIYTSYKIHMYTQKVTNYLYTYNKMERKKILKNWNELSVYDSTKKIFYDDVSKNMLETKEHFDKASTREVLDLHIGMHLKFIKCMVEVGHVLYD